MAKGKQGDQMDKKDEQPDPSKGVQPVANEFAPNVVQNGNGGTDVVESKPSQDEGVTERGYEADRPENDERYEREFVNYVNGELKAIADKLGYDLALKKRAASGNGPVMRYHRQTLEGKVFQHPSEAGDDYMSGDELRAIQEG